MVDGINNGNGFVPKGSNNHKVPPPKVESYHLFKLKVFNELRQKIVNFEKEVKNSIAAHDINGYFNFLCKEVDFLKEVSPQLKEAKGKFLEIENPSVHSLAEIEKGENDIQLLKKYALLETVGAAISLRMAKFLFSSATDSQTRGDFLSNKQTITKFSGLISNKLIEIYPDLKTEMAKEKGKAEEQLLKGIKDKEFAQSMAQILVTQVFLDNKIAELITNYNLPLKHVSADYPLSSPERVFLLVDPQIAVGENNSKFMLGREYLKDFLFLLSPGYFSIYAEEGEDYTQITFSNFLEEAGQTGLKQVTEYLKTKKLTGPRGLEQMLEGNNFSANFLVEAHSMFLFGGRYSEIVKKTNFSNFAVEFMGEYNNFYGLTYLYAHLFDFGKRLAFPNFYRAILESNSSERDKLLRSFILAFFNLAFVVNATAVSRRPALLSLLLVLSAIKKEGKYLTVDAEKWGKIPAIVQKKFRDFLPEKWPELLTEKLFVAANDALNRRVIAAIGGIKKELFGVNVNTPKLILKKMKRLFPPPVQKTGKEFPRKPKEKVLPPKEEDIYKGIAVYARPGKIMDLATLRNMLRAIENINSALLAQMTSVKILSDKQVEVQVGKDLKKFMLFSSPTKTAIEVAWVLGKYQQKIFLGGKEGEKIVNIIFEKLKGSEGQKVIIWNDGVLSELDDYKLKRGYVTFGVAKTFLEQISFSSGEIKIEPPADEGKTPIFVIFADKKIVFLNAQGKKISEEEVQLALQNNHEMSSEKAQEIFAQTLQIFWDYMKPFKPPPEKKKLILKDIMGNIQVLEMLSPQDLEEEVLNHLEKWEKDQSLDTYEERVKCLTQFFGGNGSGEGN